MRYIGASPTSFGEDRKKYVVGSGGVNAGDTVFNVSYDEGKVDAYLNGIRLFPDTDFTRTASGVGSNITLASGVGAGDVLELFGLQGVHGGNGLVEDRFVVGTGSTGSGGSYTNSTTVFPTASNVGDTVSVWRNGVKLVHTTDYTVQPAASTVTLGSAASTADEICIQVVGIVTSANFIPKTGGTFTGEVEVPTLKLSSNVIKASDGGSTITLDTSDNVTIAGGLTVTQDFTVNGTTTTVNTTNTVVEDSLIGLNNGATSNTNDCGLIIERGSTGNDALIMWDESEDKWTLGTSTSTASSTGNLNITVGTLVANLEGNVTGTIQTAAQANITSVGTLTSATISGDLTVDTNTLKVDSSGNKVGIGEGSPQDALHIVESSTRQLRLEGSAPSQYFKETDTTNQNFQLRLDDGKFLVQTNNDAFNSASTKVTFDQSGKVGIGVAPTYKLDVVHNSHNGTIAQFGGDGGDGSFTDVRIRNTHQASSSTNEGARLIFELGNTNAGWIEAFKEADGSSAGNRTGGLAFYTTNANSTTEKLRINSSGNVGIGDGLSPAVKLDVEGTDSNVACFSKTNDTGCSISIRTAESQNEGANFYHLVGSTAPTGATSQNAVAGLRTKITNSGGALTGELSLHTNGGDNYGERLKVASNGNVTISDGDLIIPITGHGIHFSSTNTPGQSAGTGSSNTLDDYEIGSWNPVLSDGSNDHTMHSDTAGKYVKIGDVVHLTAMVRTGNLSGDGITLTNSIRINGIPFQIGSGTKSRGGVAIGYYHLYGLDDGGGVMGAFWEGYNYIQLYESGATSGGTLTCDDFHGGAAGFYLMFSGTYHTD